MTAELVIAWWAAKRSVFKSIHAVKEHKDYNRLTSTRHTIHKNGENFSLRIKRHLKRTIKTESCYFSTSKLLNPLSQDTCMAISTTPSDLFSYVTFSDLPKSIPSNDIPPPLSFFIYFALYDSFVLFIAVSFN